MPAPTPSGPVHDCPDPHALHVCCTTRRLLGVLTADNLHAPMYLLAADRLVSRWRAGELDAAFDGQLDDRLEQLACWADDARDHALHDDVLWDMLISRSWLRLRDIGLSTWMVAQACGWRHSMELLHVSVASGMASRHTLGRVNVWRRDRNVTATYRPTRPDGHRWLVSDHGPPWRAIQVADLDRADDPTTGTMAAVAHLLLDRVATDIVVGSRWASARRLPLWVTDLLDGPIVTLDGELSHDTVATALTLWSRDEPGSPYRHLRACVDSAARLTAAP